MPESSARTTERTALVFGATGYTGKAVVRRWASLGRVVAHVRPDSPTGAVTQAEFEALGAQVQVVAWEAEPLAALVAEVKPDVVFALLGTTRARAKRELSAEQSGDPYHAVDERLSLMAADAVKQAAPQALFIYLSALGVSANTNNAYLRARYRVESALAQSGLCYVIARPAVISGTDRSEFRLGERAVALGLDATLNLAALTGLRGLRDLKQGYASLSGDQLAAALVAIGRDGKRTGEVLAAELRRYAVTEAEQQG